MSFSLYNPDNAEILNTKFCDEVRVFMPIGDTIDFSKNPYKDLRDLYRVNIFNQSDPFFNDRCFVYQLDGVDVPINSRKDFIFPNVTSSCGFSCDFMGLDINGTVECSCKNPSMESTNDLIQEINKILFTYAYDSTNLIIVSCDVNFQFKL